MALSSSLLYMCFAFAASTLAIPARCTNTPTVTIESGPVFGVATRVPGAPYSVHKYLGVPFAAEPVRFAPPTAAKPWTEPFNATANGPACIQQFIDPLFETIFNIPPPLESEDCLNMNIYVPASDTQNKTVMVWIFGGRLEFGSNAWSLYDGTNFAGNQDIILVAINHRTNVFGFPGAPGLPLAKRNLGYLDQRFALQWIQRNIAAFGGDPKKVTIFGESAGGVSVDSLLTTTPNNPPFRAAIMQSGQNNFYLNPENTPTDWNSLANLTGCLDNSDFDTPLACIRSLPATLIKETIENNTLSFTALTTDNVTQLRYPEVARYEGRIAHVPVMIGSNADEGSLSFSSDGSVGGNEDEELPELVTTLPIEIQEAIEENYTVGSPDIPDFRTRNTRIITDWQFQCPASHLANDSVSTVAKPKPIPAYRYFFNATFANTQFRPGIGVFHGSEISILFGTYPPENSTAEQHEMSAFMQTTWANFAKDPTCAPWPMNPAVAVLGNSRGQWKNATIVDAGTLDFRCDTFRQAYVEQGSAVPAEQ